MAEHSKRRRGAAILALVAGASVGFVSSVTSHAAIRTWLTTSGLYETAGNWSGGVVPVPTDSVLFNLNGPYTVSFSAPRSITSATILGDGVAWNLGSTTYTVNAATAGALTVGQGTIETSNLTLTNGTVNAFGATMGLSGTSRGTLTVGAGATLNLSSSLTVGNNGSGSAIVTNAGNLLTNALNVGVNAGSTGDVLVNGFGSSASVTGANACVIGGAGAGSFTVREALTTTNGVTLGNAASGAGVVTVTDGSGWANSGTFSVGNAGAGTVNVSAAVLSTHFLTFAGQVGSRGVAQFTNNAIVTCENDLIVGSLGAATVSIESASVMNCGGSLFVGAQLGGRGQLNVVGGNTQLSISGQLALASQIGAASTLNIANGAVVANAGSAQIAVWDGSSAVINISGPGSKWISDGPVQIAGSGFSLGSATVTIGAGASMIVAGTNSLTLAGTGVLTLDGGTLSIGTFNNAGGLFNFNAGTVVFTGGSFAIETGAPLGSVIDLGANKTITVTGAAQIAAGALLRMSGGNFNAGSLSNTGEILLDSPTSVLGAPITNSGLIRGDGQIRGALTNNLGGEVRASGDQRIAFFNDTAGNTNAGSINLFGGMVEFDHLLTNTGRITGRGALIANGGVINDGTITLSAGVSDVIGALTNSSGGKTIITGGSTSTFFDDVTNQPGSEFRVSIASTAVFLGNVSGLGAFTGPGTKDFEGNASGLMINTQTGTTIVGPDATLTATLIRDAALHVEGMATIASNGSIANVSRVGTLDISGTLDLNDNDLIATATSRALIESQIAFARHDGAWDREGLSSSAARTRPQHNTTLGVLSGAEHHAIYGTAGSFDGFAVAASDVLVKYTWYGDTDLNGVVNFDDYARIDSGFNNGLAGWVNGDFDLNGVVNFDDYALIDLAFNTQSGVLIGMNAVPEPGGPMLLTAGAILPLARRRRVV